MKNIQILIALALMSTIASCTADRDDSGQIISEGSLDAFSIRVGDCSNDEDESLLNDDSEDISSVLAIPCDQPHDNEFYHVFDVNHAEFPGEESMYDEAYQGCLNEFEAFVGLEYDSSVLEIYTLYPSSESWAAYDREVVCGLFHIDLEKLEGSMKGSAI